MQKHVEQKGEKREWQRAEAVKEWRKRRMENSNKRVSKRWKGEREWSRWDNVKENRIKKLRVEGNENAFARLPVEN